jgi:hypothetical protein
MILACYTYFERTQDTYVQNVCDICVVSGNIIGKLASAFEVQLRRYGVLHPELLGNHRFAKNATSFLLGLGSYNLILSDEHALVQRVEGVVFGVSVVH